MPISLASGLQNRLGLAWRQARSWESQTPPSNYLTGTGVCTARSPVHTHTALAVPKDTALHMCTHMPAPLAGAAPAHGPTVGCMHVHVHFVHTLLLHPALPLTYTTR